MCVCVELTVGVMVTLSKAAQTLKMSEREMKTGVCV